MKRVEFLNVQFYIVQQWWHKHSKTINWKESVFTDGSSLMEYLLQHLYIIDEIYRNVVCKFWKQVFIVIRTNIPKKGLSCHLFLIKSNKRLISTTTKYLVASKYLLKIAIHKLDQCRGFIKWFINTVCLSYIFLIF